jgi:lysophospholipase L1-like esterase
MLATTLLATTLLATTLLAPASAGAVPVAADRPLRVLLVGDSVTQGSAGDWTWRYRLWQQLTADGTAVDFVGPYDDLFDNVGGDHGDRSYLDPDFDRDHAARWGLSFAFPADDIGDLVRDHQPDVVVETLGVNDLTFLGMEPAAVADEVRAFVADARAVDPEVDVVLGRQPQTWYAGVSAFNDLLDDVAVDLDDEASRVVVAAPDTGFAQRTHTWDSAHANAQGELLVAAAVADAFAELGLAPAYPRPLPTVPLGPRRAAALSARAIDGAAALTWVGPPGADREIVWLRDLTSGTPWRRLPGEVPEPLVGAHVVDGLVNGHRYAVRLQPAKGYWAAAPDVRSNVVRVRPLPPPPGPVRVRSLWSPRPDRVRVVGVRVAGATGYRLQIAPLASCRTHVGSTRTLRDLSGPSAAFATHAPAVRVRLVATNLAGPGPTAAWSPCLRVR